MLWEQLLIMEPEGAKWFENKPLMIWSLTRDEGKRSGIMTTNYAESWNNAILEASNLLVTSLVRVLLLKKRTIF